VEATKIFFANALQKLFWSTLFRMNYLSQPIAGFLLLTSQLFSGRVMQIQTSVPGWTNIAEL